MLMRGFVYPSNDQDPLIPKTLSAFPFLVSPSTLLVRFNFRGLSSAPDSHPLRPVLQTVVPTCIAQAVVCPFREGAQKVNAG